MLKKERAIYIVKKLEEVYPETPIPLDSKSKFQLLIAVNTAYTLIQLQQEQKA